MAKRKRISPKVESELLVLSGRRCCLCFGLNNDFSEKSGQIAHVNQDSSDARLENLAWLCLDHHDKYDSRTSQSKGYTIEELKRYRSLLYEEVERRRASESTAAAPAKIIVVGSTTEPPRPRRERLRDVLNGISPEVLQRIDAGHGRFEVVINMSNMARLQQIEAEGGFEGLLRWRPTPKVSIASSGCSFGNAIMDLQEGGVLTGYMMEPLPGLADQPALPARRRPSSAHADRGGEVADPSKAQRQVISVVVDNYLETTDWVPGRVVRMTMHTIEGELVTATLDSCVPVWLRRAEGRPDDNYEPTLPGLLVSSKAGRISHFIELLIGYLRASLIRKPRLSGFSWKELCEALHLDPMQDFELALATILVGRLGAGGPSSPRGSKSFEFKLPYDIEDILKCEDVWAFEALRSI